MVVSEIAEAFIKENPIMVFSKSYCPYCVKAKGKFDQLKKPYKAIELDQRADGDEIKSYLYQKTGQNTVPYVYINQKLIGKNHSSF